MNQQCLVSKFQCDLCDAADYVGFTRRHLHQRVEQHKNSSSSIRKHFRDKHSLAPKDLTQNFSVLTRRTNKFDCLICEMFFIHKLRPLSIYTLTQFVLRFLINFLISFSLVFSLYDFIVRLHLQISYIFILLTCIYIFSLFYFTTLLIMTEARSKGRVLPLIVIVKRFKKPSLIRLTVFPEIQQSSKT